MVNVLPRLARALSANPISVVGGVLVLLGLLLPWFSFLVVPSSRSQYPGQVIIVYLSPVFLRVDTPGSSDFSWLQLNAGALVVALSCVAGSILGILGGALGSRPTFAGGALSIAATAVFPSCLPGNLYDMKLELGGLVTGAGGALIALSSLWALGLPGTARLRILGRVVRSLEALPFERKLCLALEGLAVAGSAYNGYELARIVYLTVTLKSLTLSSAGHPPWVFWLEIALCLYASVYWILRATLGPLWVKEGLSRPGAGRLVEREPSIICEKCDLARICSGPWGAAESRCAAVRRSAEYA